MPRLKVEATTTGYNTIVVDAPALEGSEKQIAWAEDIRAQKAAELNKQVNAVAKQKGWDYSVKDADDTGMDSYADQITDMINSQIGETAAEVFASTSAKYWIDSRNRSIGEMLRGE